MFYVVFYIFLLCSIVLCVFCVVFWCVYCMFFVVLYGSDLFCQFFWYWFCMFLHGLQISITWKTEMNKIGNQTWHQDFLYAPLANIRLWLDCEMSLHWRIRHIEKKMITRKVSHRVHVFAVLYRFGLFCLFFSIIFYCFLVFYVVFYCFLLCSIVF